MRTKLTTFALAGVVGLTGVAGAALLAPAISYAATGDSSALERRVTGLRDALAGLVTDGTITQDQADKVASTLAQARTEGGHGHRGGGRGLHLAEAAESLGFTREELRAAAEAGKTLTQLAEEQGVGTQDLVAALVKAEQARLAEAVTAGRLTQAEADERSAGLQARITERLDDPIGVKGGRQHGPRDQAPTPAPAD